MKNSSDNPLQALVFTVGEYHFAIDMAYLSEVAEPVTATPLPFVPDFVDGLINIAGQIMPQINAMRLFKAGAESLKTLLVLDIEQIPLALLVNQVLETVQVEEITANASDNGALAGEFVWHDQTVALIDADKLTGLVRANKVEAGKPGFLGKLKANLEEIEVCRDLFLFRVADKDYAFDLSEVDEIIELHSLHALPRAPSFIAGLSLVRTEPRMILNTSTLLGSSDYGDGQVAVVVDVEAAYVGLLIDKIIGIESIPERLIRHSRDGKQHTIERANGALVPILQVGELIDPVLNQMLPFLPAMRKQDRRLAVKEIEFLRFRLNGDYFAFQIDHIKRVVTGKSIEPLLTEQAWIIGTIEIEGRVIPVVDLIAQLGYQSPRELLREFIVVGDGQSDWALATQISEQIIAIKEPMIDWVDADAANYVSAFVNLNEQLMTILNPMAICADNQRRLG